MLTLGVIADTHVPDRRRSLDPRILTQFRLRSPQAILHAGDVSAPFVLEELAEIAPVYAVRGNRDWLWLRELPPHRILEFAGARIALTHGHGGWLRYLLDRPYFTLQGYHHERLAPRLLREFPRVKVIIFGHGHQPLNRWINGQLLFNPGSPNFPENKNLAPSLGILTIQNGGEVSGEIIQLD